ncbi:uncharacterized protein [Typha angustifolia]|uniref:uncharacterized protein isoform X3 n=1 Tax=Typha angustifolia TaxID=59011 RepID=UPI003C2FAF10
MEKHEQPLADGLPGSDENERRKVAELRELVEEKDPAAKEVDNVTLRRFLRSRDQDVKKASRYLLKHLNWRRSAVPNGFISEAEIKNELLQRKVFAQGFDKVGRPIAIVLNAKHDPAKRDLAEFKRSVVYLIDKLCARTGGDQEKFTIIGDFKDWGFSNCDLRAYLAALDILQFVFLENENMTDKLLEDIDESQLPEIYGGKLPLVPIEESISKSEATNEFSA